MDMDVDVEIDVVIDSDAGTDAVEDADTTYSNISSLSPNIEPEQHPFCMHVWA